MNGKAAGGAPDPAQAGDSEGQDNDNHNDSAEGSVFTGPAGQEVSKLRKENETLRRRLKETEKTRDKYVEQVSHLRQLVVGDRVSAALKLAGIDPSDDAKKAAHTRLSKMVLADLQVAWGEDGLTLDADVDTAVKAALADLGMVASTDAPKGAEPTTKQPATPAEQPKTPVQPPIFPHMAQRPTAPQAGNQAGQQPLQGGALLAAIMAQHGVTPGG